jgi:hypothetical protein
MTKTPAKSDQTPRKGFFTGLFDLVSSVGFALTVLIILGALGIIGAVVPQRPADVPAGMEEAFAANLRDFLGDTLAGIAQTLGFDRLFTSFYFLGLLLALALSLIVCTWRKVGKLLRQPALGIPASGINIDLPPNLDAMEALERLGYRARGDAAQAVAERHKWNLWGSVCIHISLLTFLLSGFLTWKFSQHDEVNLTPGPEVFLSAKLLPGATAQVSDAALVRDPNTNAVLEYRTDLSIYALGEEIASGTVRVNHPLEVAGVTIYQTNMQEDALGLGLAARPAADATEPPMAPDLTVLNGATFFLGGMPISIEVMNPRDLSGKMALLDVGGNMVPLSIGKSAKVATPRGDYDLWYLGPHETLITGLTLKRPAGMELFWAACVILSLGLLTVFLPFYHRVRLSKDDRGNWLLMVSGRSDVAMDEKRDKLLARIKGWGAQ